MRSAIRDLQPINVDSARWRRREIRITLDTLDAEQVEYEGDALVSEPDQTHSVEFEFKSHPFSPATIKIPLAVSAPCSARLRANDQLVGTFELGASPERTPVLHILAADVTKGTETSKVSHLRLRISYGERGTTTILLGDDQGERKPGVIQEWSWRYASQSLAFFVLAWANILGLAILLVVNIRSFGDTFRLYAVLTMVAAWGFSVLGISDLAKIPFRSLLRKLYARTRRHRAVSLAALALLFVLVSSGAAAVIYSLRVRQHYSDLIHQAMAMDEGPDQDEIIKRAFILLPSRKEAQYLFERRAWVLRDSTDMRRFRQYVRNFVSESEVKHTVAMASSSRDLPFCLDQSAGKSFSDPIVWYASLLPEADEDRQHTFEEIDIYILAARDAASDPEGRVFRTYLRLDLDQVKRLERNETDPPELNQAEKDQANEEERVNELRGLLLQYSNYSNVAATQTYQMGCDIVACYYIKHCKPTEASEWFRRELEARSRQRTAGDILWQRPPEKLNLYHMFLYELNAPGANIKNADKLLHYRANDGQCEPYEKEFKRSIFDPDKDYRDKGAWFKGTVLDGSQDLVINTLLNRGWRY